MSSTVSAQRANPGLVVLILLAVLGALAISWWLITALPPLDRSALGMKGFAIVASKNKDLDIRFFSGSERLDPEEIGLRILPLYDPDIFQPSNKIRNNSDNEILRPLSRVVYYQKLKNIPTLVILPKWRREVVEQQKLHQNFLINSRSMRLPYNSDNQFGASEIRRGDYKFFTQKTVRANKHLLDGFQNRSKLSLYIPQTISQNPLKNAACQPARTFNENTLLARCSYFEREKVHFWLLTDPDVMNNHGAGNGDNYQFTVDLISFLAKGKPVIIDGTSRVFSNTRAVAKERARSFADLGRFFTYPFSLAWVALTGLIFFSLWHAWRRTGPILDSGRDETELRASKATVIDADVAILRGVDKSGPNDIKLARLFASQRMLALSSEVFGSGRKPGEAGEEQFFAALSRRNQTLAEDLKHVRSTLKSGTVPESKQSFYANLKQFEQLTREARDEFAGPSNAG